MVTSKLTLRAKDAALAHSLAGALENLGEPLADAVTAFEEGRDSWCVEAYYSCALVPKAIETQLGESLLQSLPAPEVAELPDLNWVAISQAALPPVSAGRFLVHGSHDRGRVPRGPNTIAIDAGEAFGTAHHATTQGCLLAIDRLTRARTFCRVLDLGCGSGVLAIAAARVLPKARILAADNDPQAVAVASANARANCVSQRISFVCATGLAHRRLRAAAPFGLVIANILAGPLCVLAPELRRALQTGGFLVLSGILLSEVPTVIATYVSTGFALVEHRASSGWSTLILRKFRVAEPARRTANTGSRVRIARGRREP